MGQTLKSEDVENEVRTFMVAARNRIEVLVTGLILRNAHIRLFGEVVRIVSVRIISEAGPVLQRSAGISEGRRFDDWMVGGASGAHSFANGVLRIETKAATAKARTEADTAAKAERGLAFIANLRGDRFSSGGDSRVLRLNVRGDNRESGYEKTDKNFHFHLRILRDEFATPEASTLRGN